MGRIGHILFVLCAVYIGLLCMIIIAVGDMREQVRHLDFQSSELNQRVSRLESDLKSDKEDLQDLVNYIEYLSRIAAERARETHPPFQNSPSVKDMEQAEKLKA
jgi:uncharacterized protein YpmS